MADLLDYVRRIPTTTEHGDGVAVFVADPIEGFKPLGYIKAHGENWLATPARDMRWWYAAEHLTDREAIIYLMGIRGGRFGGFDAGELVPCRGTQWVEAL